MKNTTNLARMSSKTLTEDQLETVVAGGSSATKPGDSAMKLTVDDATFDGKAPKPSLIAIIAIAA